MATYILGPEGTFSHELALRLKTDDIRLVPSIGRIFSAVAEGKGDGIVPIENSEAGGVGATLDGLQSKWAESVEEVIVGAVLRLSVKK